MQRFTALILFAQVLLIGAFLFRSDKTLSDFPAFYAATRLWQKGEQPYDLQSQCREQTGFARDECLPFVHPPVLLPILSLLINGNFSASYWRWVSASFFVLIVSLIPLFRLTADFATSIQAILWQPIVAGVWMGQDNAFVFVAIVFFVWLIKEERDVLAGIALSFATIKPHFAIALAVPLLFARPRAFAGFAIGGSCLVLYSLALVGVEGFRGALNATSVMAQGEGFGIWREGMCNFAGTLARAGVNAPLLVWVVFLLSIAAISFYWSRQGVTLKTISVGLVVVMFTAPHVHPWDLAPLVIPLSLINRLVVMTSSAILFALMPWRLLHWGCYAILLGLYVWLRRYELTPKKINAATG